MAAALWAYGDQKLVEDEKARNRLNPHPGSENKQNPNS